jgi:formyltetrahydrofolate synthetase
MFSIDLALAVSDACKAGRTQKGFRFLYPLSDSLKTKIETVCREMYGAVGVEYTEQAEKRLEVITDIFQMILYILLILFMLL